MKKMFKRSFVYSLILSTVVFLLETLSGFLFHFLPISYAMAGGDCISHIGIGWILEEIFPMTIDPSANSVFYRMDFYPISLFFFFILLMLIYSVLQLVRKKK